VSESKFEAILRERRQITLRGDVCEALDIVQGIDILTPAAHVATLDD